VVAVVGADGVALYGMTLAHRPNGTQLPVGLGDLTERIYARIDSFVVDLGKELQEAFECYPDVYEQWVTECLPFGLDKARRLRMVYKASVSLPEHVLARLPRPWQAAFAISRLAPEQIIEAVESGGIHPDLTVREANEIVAGIKGGSATRRFSAVDLIVGKLVGHPVEQLGGEARSLLERWLATGPS